jgi:hypothetical protein
MIRFRRELDRDGAVLRETHEVQVEPAVAAVGHPEHDGADAVGWRERRQGMDERRLRVWGAERDMEGGEPGEQPEVDGGTGGLCGRRTGGYWRSERSETKCAP